jgi:hypothetical protein
LPQLDFHCSVIPGSSSFGKRNAKEFGHLARLAKKLDFVLIAMTSDIRVSGKEANPEYLGEAHGVLASTNPSKDNSQIAHQSPAELIV